MLSKIVLEQVKIYAFHGVLPEENIIGTYYLLDAEVMLDLQAASQSDALEETVSYADINDIIIEEMKINSKLLEHVAGRIIRSIRKQFPEVSSVKVKILKTNPPMPGEMKGAGVVLEG